MSKDIFEECLTHSKEADIIFVNSENYRKILSNESVALTKDCAVFYGMRVIPTENVDGAVIMDTSLLGTIHLKL